MSFSNRHSTYDEVNQTLENARTNLKAGRLGQKRTERILSLHRGILLVR